jgi:ABC-type antimicrobial peptide transport system permease subunit
VLLALIGLHAALAYSVRQREREIAIRMALGAERRSVIRAFVVQGAWTLGAGVALGVPAAMAMGRLLQAELFGVRPAEPWLLAATALILAGCGLVSVWQPARRAARTDPAVALRGE